MDPTSLLAKDRRGRSHPGTADACAGGSPTPLALRPGELRRRRGPSPAESGARTDDARPSVLGRESAGADPGADGADTKRIGSTGEHGGVGGVGGSGDGDGGSPGSAAVSYGSSGRILEPGTDRKKEPTWGGRGSQVGQPQNSTQIRRSSTAS